MHKAKQFFYKEENGSALIEVETDNLDYFMSRVAEKHLKEITAALNKRWLKLPFGIRIMKI